MYKFRRWHQGNEAGQAVRVGMVGPDRSVYDALARARNTSFGGVELVGYAPTPDRFDFQAVTDTLLFEAESRPAVTATLRQWRQAGHTMNVLVAADEVTDAWLADLRKAGVAYVVHKPMPADVLLRRLYQFGGAQYVSGAAMAADGRTLRAEQRVIHVLDTLRVPARLSGYRYFVTAVMIMWGTGEGAHLPVVSLYEKVAQHHRIGAAAVERAMRYALEVTWLHGDVDTINDLFGYTVCPEKGKPTNALFLNRLVDYVRLTASGPVSIAAAAKRDTNIGGRSNTR